VGARIDDPRDRSLLYQGAAKGGFLRVSGVIS
jgi:hypothetical protein